jgi:hypothetical protein
MRLWQSRTGALAALFTALLTSAVGRSDEPPPNRLSGVVVYKESGAPAANVFVAMLHGDKGYLYFDERGLRGSGNDEKVLGIFTKRNGKHFCDAVTDRAGRFTMTNFAGPDEAWCIAAGDPEKGWALQLDMHPGDYAQRPLRLELDKPAFVTTTLPAAPAKSLRTSLSVSLAPTEAPHSAENGVAEPEAATVPVYFNTDARNAKVGKEVRLGPLPGGQRYQVTAYVSGQKVPYEATIFARTVGLSPGATEKVALESAEGATVTGRVTSSEDKPLAKVNVTAETADGLVIGALTDDDGRYALHGVPPGEHALRLLRHAVRAVPG